MGDEAPNTDSDVRSSNFGEFCMLTVPRRGVLPIHLHRLDEGNAESSAKTAPNVFFVSQARPTGGADENQQPLLGKSVRESYALYYKSRQARLKRQDSCGLASAGEVRAHHPPHISNRFAAEGVHRTLRGRGTWGATVGDTRKLICII